MPRPPRQLASKCHVDLVHLQLLGCPPPKHLLRSREIYTRAKCVKIFFPSLFNFLSMCSILSIAGVNWQVTKAVPRRAVPRPSPLLPRSFLEHLLASTMNLHSFEASGSPFCI